MSALKRQKESRDESATDMCMFEEPDLITNFGAFQLDRYKKAIELLGDDTLFISDEAYNVYGHKLNGAYSLRTTNEDRDRGDFWETLESLER